MSNEKFFEVVTSDWVGRNETITGRFKANSKDQVEALIREHPDFCHKNWDLKVREVKRPTYLDLTTPHDVVHVCDKCGVVLETPFCSQDGGKARKTIISRRKYLTVAEQAYEMLVQDSVFLSFLNSNGVDNWEGYSDAQKQFKELGYK